MDKYTWTATVTKPGHHPGHGNGTVEADTPEQAKELIRDFVARPGVEGTARDIKLTPEK